MKVNRITANKIEIESDEKLHYLVNYNVVVVSNMRIKGAQVYFWSEDEWQKEIAKADKRAKKIQEAAAKTLILNTAKKEDEKQNE